MELIILAVFSSALLLCVLADVSLIAALLFGYCLFFAYGLSRRRGFKELLRFSLEGVATSMNILLTFLLIGMLTAVWRSCGAIAYIVYYATALISPRACVLFSFLLCCLVSFLTGTSFGTAATVGVICAAVSGSVGVPAAYTGGAILAGSFFGDRCSPVSTSAMLVSELTGTDLYKNMSAMVKSSLVPFFVSCAVYLALGFGVSATSAADATREVFAESYVLSPLSLLPVAAVLLLSLLRAKVRTTLLVSAVLAAAVSVLVQGAPLASLPSLLVLGFHPESAALASLMDGGGVRSMLNVFFIVAISSSYSGIFKGTGFLDSIRTHVEALARRSSPFAAVLAVSVVSGVVSCNQTLNIILTQQLCESSAGEPEAFALYLENSAVVVSALIPWSIACAVPLASIAAPSESVFAACYLYLVPLYNLALSLRRHSKAAG